tara:strand:+ start:615 stop:767 length:153 start_codon:yes stop_codon:yes gene_type:complete
MLALKMLHITWRNSYIPYSAKAPFGGATCKILAIEATGKLKRHSSYAKPL